jgi:hypothetical protein
LALVFGILVGVVGCQSAVYNTYSVPGKTAGGGLRYYDSSFPRGEKPDPWEGQGQESAEPEREEDAEKEETAGSPGSP